MALAAPGLNLPWEAPIFPGRPHSLASLKQERQKGTLPCVSPCPCPQAVLGCWPDAPGVQGTLGFWGPLWAGVLGLAGLPQRLIIVTGRVSVSILPAFGQKKKGKRRERREWRERAEGGFEASELTSNSRIWA